MTTIFDVPGSNPPNPFTTPIQALLATNLSAPVLDQTAASLVRSITTSPDSARALWKLWDAFFTAVVTSSTSHEPHLALLNALREHPPTQPNNLTLPRFDAQWRDVHDILEAWRDWDGVRESSAKSNSTAGTLTASGAKYFLRFCSFSAALLKDTKGRGEVHPVWVFYACRKGLESYRPQSDQAKAHRMTPEQLWALDIRIAAIWMRDGGQVLWEAGHEELRHHWAAALDDQTELWPREDGLMRERWQLWADRLWYLSREKGVLDEETRVVVIEAAGVVRWFLNEAST